MNTSTRPPTDCLGCPKFPERDKLAKMIAETHLAVVGNEKIGVTGLVTRVNRVEHKQRKMWLYTFFGGGVIAGAALGVKGVVTAILGGK